MRDIKESKERKEERCRKDKKKGRGRIAEIEEWKGERDGETRREGRKEGGRKEDTEG